VRKGLGLTRWMPDACGMVPLAVILLIVGVVLLLLGLFVSAAKFLLWIGIVLLVIAVIIGLMRYIRRGA
jgi:membrane-bound ClpP family serine protease